MKKKKINWWQKKTLLRLNTEEKLIHGKEEKLAVEKQREEEIVNLLRGIEKGSGERTREDWWSKWQEMEEEEEVVSAGGEGRGVEEEDT